MLFCKLAKKYLENQNNANPYVLLCSICQELF
uniref:Uncharacterized protein n=1 Tax=Wuchereria bancrofti TaxID=6293 RepID=A0AAF5PXQ3_WUCBA